MTWREEMIWCDGCGVEITWGPVVLENRTYCCQDCAEGFPCACGERMELDEDMRESGAGITPAHTGYLA